MHCAVGCERTNHVRKLPKRLKVRVLTRRDLQTTTGVTSAAQSTFLVQHTCDAQSHPPGCDTVRMCPLVLLSSVIAHGKIAQVPAMINPLLSRPRKTAANASACSRVVKTASRQYGHVRSSEREGAVVMYLYFLFFGYFTRLHASFDACSGADNVCRRQRK